MLIYGKSGIDSNLRAQHGILLTTLSYGANSYFRPVLIGDVHFILWLRSSLL